MPDIVIAKVREEATAVATLWNHFILANAVARLAEAKPAASGFCYVDTHAGTGRLAPPALLPDLLASADGFAATAYFAAIGENGDAYPGSWVVAGRAIRMAAPEIEVEVDINDIAEPVILEARRHREVARTRFWSHDWFLFLRTRLGVGDRPDFVFIDPPADDPRGPAYAIDAAILLDAMAVPYMLTYPVDDPQQAVDQIGRTGLELNAGGNACGVLLGGGAEAVVLHLLPDLRRLAGVLGGELSVRLPRGDDYVI